MSLYSTSKPSTWYGRLSLKALEAIDISENLVRITEGLRNIPNGIISLVMAVIGVLPTIGFFALAYYFDIDSSHTALGVIRDPLMVRLEAITAGGVIGSAAAFLIWSVPTSLTLLPTATEMVGAKFARFNVAAFQWAVWGFATLDLATDIPRVNEMLELAWPHFVTQPYAESGFWGILFSFNGRVYIGAIFYHVIWTLALLGASYFLELIAVLCVWAVAALLFKSLGYWVMSWFAGSKWAKKFNRDGGFSDESVGATRPRSRSAPVEDDDGSIDPEDLFGAMGGSRSRA